MRPPVPRRQTLQHLLRREGFRKAVAEVLVGESLFPESMFQSQTEVRESDLEELSRADVLSNVRLQTLEAIVREVGRPVYLVQGNSFVPTNDRIWGAVLSQFSDKINGMLPAVGRVELRSSGGNYIGTGWLIDDDVLITNRHVAEQFIIKVGDQLIINSTSDGTPLDPQVDFRVEDGSTASDPRQIIDGLFLARRGPQEPDVAILRISKGTPLHQGIELADDLPLRGAEIVVVGYPGYDAARNDPYVMDRLFENRYGVKRMAPGEVIGCSENGATFDHDCTTLGGNSGSPIQRLSDGKIIGLHFSGTYRERNVAVTAPVLSRALKDAGWLPRSVLVSPLPRGDETPVIASGDEVDRSFFGDRKGYDETFLSEQYIVPTPIPKTNSSHVTVPVEGRDDAILLYTHFSIVVHAERRFALFVACNVDCSRRRPQPLGRDRWLVDPRIPRQFQVGEELYVRNRINRGQLISRWDAGWGDTDEEANNGAADTLFFTNCTPQHEKLSQSSWSRLQEYILAQTDKSDLRACVFTGPVLRDTDKQYRRVKIPEDYWKVIIVVNERTNKPSATAYLLSQAELLDDLEFVYGSYRTYQVPIAEVENRSGLTFDKHFITSFDPLSRGESTPFRLIERPEDIVL